MRPVSVTKSKMVQVTEHICILTLMSDLLLGVSYLCLTQPEEGAWAEQQLAR